MSEPVKINYFETIFPTIVNYDGDFCRDLYRAYDILQTNLDDNIIEDYVVKKDDTLYSISKALYDTSDYWFAIALINGIQDPFYDFPQTNESLYRTVLKINNNIYDNRVFEELAIENDAKRTIKVIKRDYITKFVSDLKIALKVV